MDNNYYGNICYCRKCNGIVHTIKKGDSLYLLSRYYNVPIGEIMNANRNLNVYNLQIGQEICIPIRRSDMENNTMENTMTTSSLDTDETAGADVFDKNIRMSELIAREDMTFEKFQSLLRNES